MCGQYLWGRPLRPPLPPSLPCLRHKWASARWGWIIWVTAFQLFHNLLTKAPVCSKNHPKLPKVPTTAQWWASMLYGWAASNLSTIGCIVTCSWCKALKEYNGSKGQFWIWDNSNKELYEKFNSCAQVKWKPKKMKADSRSLKYLTLYEPLLKCWLSS